MNSLSFGLSLKPMRFTDALIGYGRAVYALNQLIFLVVSRFFEKLFSGNAYPKGSAAGEGDFVQGEEVVRDSNPAKRLGDALKLTFNSKVQYSADKNSVVEAGTYIFNHLFDQGKGGVHYDPSSEVYTVSFPAEKRIPVIFSDKVATKLNGYVEQPELRLAKTFQVKVKEGGMQFLGDSLMGSAKIQTGIFGKIPIGVTFQSLKDKAPPLDNSVCMQASIALNKGTNRTLRGVVNNVLCPLLNKDLSQLKIRREPAIKLLHSILYHS